MNKPEAMPEQISASFWIAQRPKLGHRLFCAVSLKAEVQKTGYGRWMQMVPFAC
jgi:hypothetical protein